MADNTKIIADKLWKDPSSKNWDSFASALKKSDIKYYKVVYEKGKIANKEDLRDSYAELYDSKSRPAAKVPIYKKDGAKIRGATIYLTGLLNINK